MSSLPATDRRRRARSLRSPYIVKRTFIDFEETLDGHAGGDARRARSAPPAPSRNGGEAGQRTEERVSSAAARQKPLTMVRSASQSEISSATGTSASTANSKETGGATRARDLQPGVTRLSDVLWVKHAGLRSLGGRDHAQGECQACVVENRHRHGLGPPCIKGMLCERCHEHHNKIPSKHKSGALRRALKKEDKSEALRRALMNADLAGR